MQPLQCGSQHQLANLHLSTHRTTPEHQMTRVMQPFQCDLQAQIPKHPITTHTQAHPKQLEATVIQCGKKKKANRPQPQPPHRRGTFHRRLQPLYTEKHKVSCSGFLPKTYSPCNIMQPLQCGSQHQLANLHLSMHRTAPEHQMTRVMQPFQCDLQAQIPKHPITTHTQAHPKQLEATVTMRPKKKRQTDPSRNRRTDEVPFIVACSHFTRKNTRFRAPASSPKHSPCNIMQPLQCGSQHQLANLHLSTHRTTPDDKSHAAIPMRSASTDSKTPYNYDNYAHTSTPKAAWSHRYNAAKKKGKPTPAATAAQTIAGWSHFTRKNTRFRAPASSPKHNPCNIHAAIPMRSATTASRHE